MVGRREASADRKTKKALSYDRAGEPFSSPSPGYPSSGCSPAEPDSVSPDGCNIAAATSAAKLKNKNSSYRKETGRQHFDA